MKCPIETGRGAAILLAYSSGEIDTETAVEFAEHLQVCAACQKQSAAQLAVWHTLDQWEAPTVSADFDRRLYARIQSETSWWRKLLQPLHPSLVRRGLPIVAAAAVIITAVVAGWPLIAPRPQTAPQSAAVHTVAPDQAEQTLQDMETLREFSRLMHAEAADPKM